MGEAKRRGGFLVKAPFAYEVIYHRLDDIFKGPLMGLLGERPSDQAIRVFQATEQLGSRMQDPNLPTMLCLTCDHEFARDEIPAEIVIATSWANKKNPLTTSPLCFKCAAESPETKTAKLLERWRKDGASDIHTVTPGAA
jgi:hypothetical protein